MKTNKLLDEWAARKLSSAAKLTNGNYVITLPSKSIIDFTLSDARCREIVRDHFKIDTNESSGDWEACGFISPTDFLTVRTGEGETIADAEVACIAEIMESE